MSKTIKKVIWIAAGLAVAGLVWSAMKPQPVEVDFAEVVSGPLMVTVDEDGETRIREPYLISAPLAGRLLRVELEPGDEITEDKVLATIDPGEPNLLDARSRAEAEARVSAAEASLKRAESQVEIAEAEKEQADRYLLRDQGRFEKGSIAGATLEDTKHASRVAQSNLHAAESALDIAGFELAQARAALLHSQAIAADDAKPSSRHFVIHSPIDGVVLRRFQESSVIIPAGERILEIGDPTDLEIRIDVLSQDAVKIEPGQRVIIEHWGGESDLSAHVRRVEPSAFTKVSALGVEEQRVWIYADFASEDPENAADPTESTQQGSAGDSTGLNPGPQIESDDRESLSSVQLGDAYRIEARIVVWEKEEAIKVPAGALFRSGENSWAVYIDREGRSELRAVEMGKNNGIEAEVIAGLEVGDRVVLHPGDRVKEGVQLAERES